MYIVDGLDFNLLNTSQLYHKGFDLMYEKLVCLIMIEDTNQVVFIEVHDGNLYTMEWDSMKAEACLVSRDGQCWLWPKILSYLNFKSLNKLSKSNLI